MGCDDSTHYDNLKVARNAPLSVIRAAYKALAQQHHPDKNPSPDAQRVMQLLNSAWEVLSDESRRAEHDAWMKEQEAAASYSASSRPTHTSDHSSGPSAPRQPGPNAQANAGHGPRRKGYEAPPEAPRRKGYTLEPEGGEPYRVVGAVVILGSIMGLAYCNDHRRPLSAPVSSPPLADSPSPPSAEAFLSEPHARSAPAAPDNAPATGPRHAEAQDIRPTGASRWSPNGEAFPTQAGYLEKMPKLVQGGLSKVTIDNTGGGSDVYMKLCEAFEERCTGLRHVFIGRGQRFSLNGIRKGVYDIRYRDLSTGSNAKSEPFVLEEMETDEGIRYSSVRMTLYTIREGNSRHSAISEDQF